MADYKKLYFSLYNDITDVIEQLKKIQQNAEENYLSQDEANIVEIKVKKVK